MTSPSILRRILGGPGASPQGDALPARETRLESEFEQARIRHEELLKNQIRTQWRILDQFDALHPRALTLQCAICGHAGPAADFPEHLSHCRFGGGRLLRHQCPECDTIFGPRKMLALSPEELSEEYEMHYRVYSEGDSTASEIRAFHALEPAKGRIYLNYGSGAWSRSVERLRAEGWDVYGYEPHDAAARGDHLIKSEEHLRSLRFDGVFSNNVLEHFPDPVGALRAMKGFLNPGARMSHATPCFAYAYEYTRFHLFFFPGRSLEALASAAGLSVTSFVADGDFMNAVFTNLSGDTSAGRLPA